MDTYQYSSLSIIFKLVEFNKKDYEELYWVVYYHARGKYFSGNSWFGKFPDRSPAMWEYQWPNNQDKLGRMLFKKGVRYVYLILTYFNEKIEVQEVDDIFLQIAFDLINCRVNKATLKKSKLSTKETNEALFKIFKLRKVRYLTLFPDLKDVLSLTIDKAQTEMYVASENFGEADDSDLQPNSADNVIVEPKVVDNSVDFDKVESIFKKVEEKQKTRAIERAKLFETPEGNEILLREMLNDYFENLQRKNFEHALMYWLPSVRSETWSNNYHKFSAQFADIQRLRYSTIIDSHIHFWFPEGIIGKTWEEFVTYYAGYGIVLSGEINFREPETISFKMKKLTCQNFTGCWYITEIKDIDLGVEHIENELFD